MTPLYVGCYQAKCAAGRIHIPRAFLQGESDECFYAFPSFEQQIQFLPEAEFCRLLEGFRKVSFADSTPALRTVASTMVYFRPDRRGRMIIPEGYLAFLGVDKTFDALWVGGISCFYLAKSDYLDQIDYIKTAEILQDAARHGR